MNQKRARDRICSTTQGRVSVQIIAKQLGLNSRCFVHGFMSAGFLANVNSSSRSLYAVARPSVVFRLSVCRLLSVVGNARAPYSGRFNFRQYFYGICYPSHPLTSTKKLTEIVPGEPLRRGS